MRIRKRLLSLSFLSAFLLPLSANAASVKVEKDPMQPFTRLRLDPSSKPYLLRAKVHKGNPQVQLYIVHSYRGDARYRSASVRWFDGTMKTPKLYDIDTDFDCSYSRYGGGCLRTAHMVIKITPESWSKLAQWASQSKTGSLSVQLQSDHEGEVFNFEVDAEHIIEFNAELVKH